jgi:hypothetical protein
MPSRLFVCFRYPSFAELLIPLSQVFFGPLRLFAIVGKEICDFRVPVTEGSTAAWSIENDKKRFQYRSKVSRWSRAMPTQAFQNFQSEM